MTKQTKKYICQDDDKLVSLTEKKIWLNGIDYIELNSVGATLTSEKNVLPQDENGLIVNQDMATHLNDIDTEWWNSLSANDLSDLFEFIENTNEYQGMVYNFWKEGIVDCWETANNACLYKKGVA